MDIDVKRFDGIDLKNKNSGLWIERGEEMKNLIWQ